MNTLGRSLAPKRSEVGIFLLCVLSGVVALGVREWLERRAMADEFDRTVAQPETRPSVTLRYNNGGTLRPAWTTAVNRSGKPERIERPGGAS